MYEARHLGTGRRVAIKVIAGSSLERSPEIIGRFRREAMASGAIESQYIAQVLDTGVDPVSGSPYTVMELLVGEDLEQAIRRLGPLQPDLALRVAAQACLGLRKAHEAGVVHRDIKPANLFLAKREDGEVVVKLLDFGIAKVKPDALSSSEDAGLTRTGAMLGSPLYMSPEQARGKKDIDHRTDIWSLGIVLYEALTGTTPYGHLDSLGELILQICSAEPRNVQETAPWVPPDLASIVHRALAVDPAKRFASMADMYTAIRSQLPQGHALTEDLFVPLPEGMRAAVAPKMPGGGGTMTGVANTQGAERSGRSESSKIAIVAPTVLTVCAVLFVVGFKIVGARRGTAGTASSTASSVSAGPLSASAVLTPPSPQRTLETEPPPAPAPAPSASSTPTPSNSAAPARRPAKRATPSAASPTPRTPSGLHMDMK